MFNNILQRKNFSIRRNATKRWKHAVAGQEINNEEKRKISSSNQQKLVQEQSLSVIIRNTSGMNTDLQKQVVEITNIALDTSNLESEIATKIKQQMDEFTGKTWHVIVGRNFGEFDDYFNGISDIRLNTILNKRRGRELFGKRNNVPNIIERQARRTRELFGKRSSQIFFPLKNNEEYYFNKLKKKKKNNNNNILPATIENILNLLLNNKRI
ncbi:hypothetical protein Mgra_00002642 [Meloidogyne graminicola]|uniref:Dynein light chain n=1 Tax=Meloidogyne graminicola TaxID=189291 RepID=A0A8S9ZXH9_9BILA|nr:hypothetical protein Mgra_00002642 [Meloidogyne graminicola]